MYPFSTLFPVLALLLLNCTPDSAKQSDPIESPQKELKPAVLQTDCEWCGAQDAPEHLSWEIKIDSKREKGTPIVISGTVYDSSGTNPQPNVLVYVYHTNTKGVYPKKGTEKGNGKRHGYLRGWMKTNAEGKYQFETIQPAPYTTHGGEPAHIHYTIQAPNQKEYWLSALWFEDDPRVTQQQLATVKRSGGHSTVTALKKHSDGKFYGTRNINLNVY